MSCSRCKNKKSINNLDNPDHINIAKEIYEQVILQGNINTYTDLDKVEIYRAYNTLYPNSSSVPSLEEAIKQIATGIQIYGIKYKR
jgi:predicted nucleic acid-binding protein